MNRCDNSNITIGWPKHVLFLLSLCVGLWNTASVAMDTNAIVPMSVSLPNARVANTAIRVNLQVCSTAANGLFIGCSSQRRTITAGNSSTGIFNYPYADPGLGSMFEISVEFDRTSYAANSPEDSSYYHGFVYLDDSGTQLSFRDNAEDQAKPKPQINQVDFPSEVNFELIYVRASTNLHINTPDGTPAELDLVTDVQICSFYAGSIDHQQCLRKEMVIPAGNDHVTFENFAYLNGESFDGFYYTVLLQYRLPGAKEYDQFERPDGSNLVLERWNLYGDTVVLASADESFMFHSVPSTLNLTLKAELDLNTLVSTLKGYNAPVSMNMAMYDSDDRLLYRGGTYQGEGREFGPEVMGDQPVAYTLSYPRFDETAYYVFNFSCDGFFPTGCDAFVSHDNRQYLKNDGTFGYGYERILPENFPAEQILILALKNGDTDGDSVQNSIDNCRNATNHTQADLDGDGVGDKCDEDTDGDGMPDEWERLNGLNPRSSADAGLDPDGDGYTNVEEYQLSFDPFTHDRDDNDNGISDRIENGLEVVPMLKTLLLRKKLSPATE